MNGFEKAPIVSVHTLRDTGLEKRKDIVDGGRFIDDVAAHGLQLVMSSRNTFDKGQLFVPEHNGDGGVDFRLGESDPNTPIEALYGRVISTIKAPGSEGIPMLNTNEVKTLAGSKIDLYRRVLAEYQVSTELISMEAGSFAAAADTIGNVATDTVVLKSNRGSGGYSTKIMPKANALEWVSAQILAGDTPAHIVQPEIMFGRLPEGINAIGTDDEKALVERAKKEKLLTELRMFVVKRADQHDIAPILRVVPTEGMPMQGQNDDYVDVELPDDLMQALQEVSSDIIDRVASEADAEYVLGAIDYYFDEHGLPHVMEANFRSPQLPVTRENPRAGRLVHTSVAHALAGMVASTKKGRE